MTNSEENSKIIAKLERKLSREKQKVTVLEKLIEERSQSLYEAKETAMDLAKSLDTIIQALPEALFVINGSGKITRSNSHAQQLLSTEESQLINQNIDSILGEPLQQGSSWEAECSWALPNGKKIPVWTSTAPLSEYGDRVLIGRDLRERKQLETQLLQAQKLESIGQLAAGIAHEINTPIQFISDSCVFLQESFEDMQPVIAAYQQIKDKLPESLINKLSELEEEADTEFIVEEVPKSLKRSIDGLKRVAEIVRAMKEFAHPESNKKSPSDINKGIESALVVAKNEYKYCAKIHTIYGDLPPVTCQAGELNQVFLNIIVNAGHAIADHVEDGQLGNIYIKTVKLQSEHVQITIEDDGGGIPSEIIDKVFDPFFTTKEVGKGTGQGLAIARNIVVAKHGGELLVENTNDGACFTITLPIKDS